MKHTPTPWEFGNRHNVPDFGGGIVFTTGGAHRHVSIKDVGALEALVFDKDDSEGVARLQANAELILRAVNVHAALVEALGKLTDAVDTFMEEAEKGEHVRAQATFPIGESFVWSLKDRVNAARAALELAKGER